MTVFTTSGQIIYMRALNGQLKYEVHIPGIRNRQLVVVRIISKTNSYTFNLLSIP